LRLNQFREGTAEGEFWKHIPDVQLI